MTSPYLRAGEYVTLPRRGADGSFTFERVLRTSLTQPPSAPPKTPADVAKRISLKALPAKTLDLASSPEEITSPEADAARQHIVDEILAAVVRQLDVPPAEILLRQSGPAGLGRLIACYLLTAIGKVPAGEAEAILQLSPGAAHSARQRFARIMARSGLSFAAETGAAVNLLFTAETLDDDTYSDIPRVSFRQCMTAIVTATGISEAVICSPRRVAPAVRARQIGFWICRTFTQLSLPDISRRFGGRDHTTALHGVRRVEPIAEALALPGTATPEEWAAALWAADWSTVPSYRKGGA
ncbi:Chromosomal replication initiator protein DnaA (modular protein) [Hyphomicrobiales bacterium]|nr:Chromosomal replication initiator protein DnaA (modular protein) [Hyphomicrobiales bacterium]CAH1667787.1 Chromosomal replication initiator protein DnaA (modular protein) [Hyphomicrobiales bacterium]